MPTTSTDARSSRESTISMEFRSHNGGDVTFRSSDNVNFYLDKKYLSVMTGGFPPSEFEHTDEEAVPLSEDSITLDLLFQFAYPKHHPDLRNLEMNTLMNLAHAAEKYEVYAAVSICRLLMSYNECALLLLGTSLPVMADHLPTAAFVTWGHYISAWELIRSAWMTSVFDTLDRRGEDGCPKASCQKTRHLRKELSLSIQPQTRVQELLDGVSCNGCRSRIMKAWGNGLASTYYNFPKYSSFSRRT
ncbi:hypothetical protein BDN72DRAFT_846883 [Pluteus cervinus]|uniref:Uncharacterized protein n=1 Tax=Pluteus cervinus TaxID=181527 RepID=A0ACD3AEM2_9AGAR|nr:hypothetical protein BDN72DRAFT_846883 [Pluteus cervinus]